MKQAFYFPVKKGPYRMRAGLTPLEKEDCGNHQDRQVFQWDNLAGYYKEQKEISSYSGCCLNPEYRSDIMEIHNWIYERLLKEGHPYAPPGPIYPTYANMHLRGYLEEYLTAQIQEDIVILKDTPDGDQTILLDVRFPSGWPPNEYLGLSFKEIHDPLPGFVTTKKQARARVDAMINRGPYVRYIWLPTQVPWLGLHSLVSRPPWDRAKNGWLRVERQVTVPFPELKASLFTIRIYLYPFAELTPEQLDTIEHVVDASQDSAEGEYKGLVENGPHIKRVIENARKEMAQVKR